MQKVYQAVLAVACALLPTAIYSSSSGPIVRVTGAPGDQTCVQGGCHSNGPNTGTGSVVLRSNSGASYAPGQTMSFTIVASDPHARVYGFQVSARLDSKPSTGVAGSFVSGNQQIVKCDNDIVRSSKGCPSIYPVEFLEHSSPFPTGTINFSWTAPATDVGPVTIYLAVNCANGDGGSGGDYIYTTKLTLASPANKAPAISSNGVVSPAAYLPNAGASPGTFLEIYGSNLASTTRQWAGSDFVQSVGPTILDQVSVMVGNKSAFVSYVSPGQVNILVPDGVPAGSAVPITITNSNGVSSAFPVSVAGSAPALLAPPGFAVGSIRYLFAEIGGADPAQTFAGPAGKFPGVISRPVLPNEIVTMYGIGFGAVTPATPAGTLASGSTALTTALTVMLGQSNATLAYQGLAPGYAGLYQINVQIPQLAPGDYPVSFQFGPAVVNTGASITIGK